MSKAGMYQKVIERVFADIYSPGAKSATFTREQVVDAGRRLGVSPKNIGDLLYSFRFRRQLPESITKHAPPGRQWVILGQGDARYCFTLFAESDLSPRKDMEPIKIPVATPEIVVKYTRSEEQALLAVVRYNRLVDLFLGVAAYSLQNHLRTKVTNVGQIEIDELYIGISKSGAQYVIPVQAKGGKDKQGISQILQDAEFCKSEFPNLVPRLIAAQFMDSNRVAMLELAVTTSGVKVRRESQYQLVAAEEITDKDLAVYKNNDD